MTIINDQYEYRPPLVCALKFSTLHACFRSSNYFSQCIISFFHANATVMMNWIIICVDSEVQARLRTGAQMNVDQSHVEIDSDVCGVRNPQ